MKPRLGIGDFVTVPLIVENASFSREGFFVIKEKDGYRVAGKNNEGLIRALTEDDEKSELLTAYSNLRCFHEYSTFLNDCGRIGTAIGSAFPYDHHEAKNLFKTTTKEIIFVLGKERITVIGVHKRLSSGPRPLTRNEEDQLSRIGVRYDKSLLDKLFPSLAKKRVRGATLEESSMSEKPDCPSETGITSRYSSNVRGCAFSGTTAEEVLKEVEVLVDVKRKEIERKLPKKAIVYKDGKKFIIDSYARDVESEVVKFHLECLKNAVKYTAVKVTEK